MNALQRAITTRPINVRGFARQIGLPEMKLRRVIDGTSSVSSGVALQIAEQLREPMESLFEEHPVKGGWFARAREIAEGVA